LRGLQRWDDAVAAFKDGRFRDPENADWDKEIEKVNAERQKSQEVVKNDRALQREADLTTELNEATIVAEREAIGRVTEHALKAGKSQKEVSELAMKGAELAKKRVHEMAQKRKDAMMLEDDKEPDEAPPYRIVCAEGKPHPKGFAHTDKGMYFMGMTLMNFNSNPVNQPWIEIYHPRKMRWSQGCGQLKLKVMLPTSVTSATCLDVVVNQTSMRIKTKGDADSIIEGELERRVDPDGDNFTWVLLRDEQPPVLEMTLDKDSAEAWQTGSYGSLLWPRLFSDDVPLGEGLFEADLTDLPPQLLEKYRRDNARSADKSLDERHRRKRMTEEEVNEEAARNWNDEFSRHGIPHRLETLEDQISNKLDCS